MLLLFSSTLFCTVEIFCESDVIVCFFLFECRSFVLDMTMETEASAVMLTS